MFKEGHITPKMIRRLSAEVKIKLLEKEIETLNEWIHLINDIFSKAHLKGDLASFINASKTVISNMENRKKSCYRELSEIRKSY